MEQKIICDWKMKRNEKVYQCGSLPISMYKCLMDCGEIPSNPYEGLNEYLLTDLSREDCEFYNNFFVDEKLLKNEKIFLKFDGVDTIADVFLNGTKIGSCDNMFRTYTFDVKDILVCGKNSLSVQIKSPLEFIEKKQQERPVWGVESTISGYPHIRKAHYMFGWDWGPKLPDLGICGDVALVCENYVQIKGVYVNQHLSQNLDIIRLDIDVELKRYQEEIYEVCCDLTLSNGRCRSMLKASRGSVLFTYEIYEPELWYPRGYGKQPLNNIRISVYRDKQIIAEKSQIIGFRKLTVNNDEKSGKFCFVCNNIEIFSMGANYIPQDQILPLCTKERTKSFIEQCLFANYNTLRIWGGGLYADDYLLQLCNENGIIVWHDFMFACASYKLTPELRETIKAEIIDNIKRIRNNPCLALWCGNNEIESMWEGWGIPQDNEAQSDYVELFEKMIPSLVKKYDPQRFYWPSSPSSGGNQYGGEGVFKNSSSNFKGDQHYWDIWHNYKPLEEFRKFKHPFCSEYGFEAIPSIKTVKNFAKEEDLYLDSPVIEAHQKCTEGNKKLRYYVNELCSFPNDFRKLIYASQLVQSDAIRSDVEHMRRNRGVCMGSLYWQVNDSNPVISWASLDYFNRRKPLHYAARRFYAPIIISCVADNLSEVILTISSEMLTSIYVCVSWTLRRNTGEIIDKTHCRQFLVNPLSSINAIKLDFSQLHSTNAEYLEYSLSANGETLSSGTSLFVKPKFFKFCDPQIETEITKLDDGFSFTLTSKAYAKDVWLDFDNFDVDFSDNFFDINPDCPVTVTGKSVGKSPTLDELIADLKIISCYDLQ